MAARSFHMYFLCSFSKFLRYFTKILYEYIQNISGWTERTTIGYTSATLRYPPLPAALWFYLTTVRPFSEIIYRKRRHIGIRIFIRIICYPISGYPDSKLSVLSIPTRRDPWRVKLIWWGQLDTALELSTTTSKWCLIDRRGEGSLCHARGQNNGTIPAPATTEWAS